MIETVLGPVEPASLGRTSMHEHVLSDARALAPNDDYLLADEQLAARELGLARAEGLATVVDPTVWGFGGPAARLPEVSRASGVQIVAGVGAYLGRTRPDWLRESNELHLTELFTKALTQSLPGCDFRAGIVGVIAPDHPRQDEDERLLRAAARAAHAAGRAMIVRLDPRFADGPETVELIAAAGLDPARVVLSNIDGYADDPATLRQLAATGATLKWCFGYEVPPRAGLRSATDAQRADALIELLRDGFRGQVLACGVWTRSALCEHGGFGYRHLPAVVVPALRNRGVGEADLRHLLVEQPAWLLNRDSRGLTAD